MQGSRSVFIFILLFLDFKIEFRMLFQKVMMFE